MCELFAKNGVFVQCKAPWGQRESKRPHCFGFPAFVVRSSLLICVLNLYRKKLKGKSAYKGQTAD